MEEGLEAGAGEMDMEKGLFLFMERVVAERIDDSLKF